MTTTIESPTVRYSYDSDARDVLGATDNHEWLQAIEHHPRLSAEDLTGAYAFLGADTDRTPKQVDEAVFHLVLTGFLKPVAISDDGRTYTYALWIPEVAR